MATIANGIENPFVGLRSFESSESHLFRGRKQHTQQLLRLLAEHRFVGVIGTSGSGKSSLVKAGLMPALYRGYLRGASSRWKIAVMRPGDSPLSRLAEALCDKNGLALAQPPKEVARRLEENSAALITLVREKLDGVEDRENVLLVVDQFEEIFRTPKDAEQERLRQNAYFVSLLLRAREELEVPIFVVLTMRSEYLGVCAQYPGLAEALSEAQYLIPRLTRDEREEAIRGPLDMVDSGIDDALVQRLLNDAGDGSDQLPALQHALMRLYEATPRGERLSLDRYSKHLHVGQSLNFHAQAIYENDLTELQRKLAEKVFRCLTTTENGNQVRRPTKLGAIYKITGVSSEEAQDDVRAIVAAFAKKDNSILFCGPGDDPLVDITHESLIRQWDLLKEWVRLECESADWFARLVRSAELNSEGKAGLWANPDFGFVIIRRSKEGWNSHWGDQYRTGFAQAMVFLENSRDAIDAGEREKRQRVEELEHARQRELENAQELAAARERELTTAKRGRKRLMFALAGLTAATIGLIYFAWLFRQERKLTDEVRKIAGGSALERIQELQNKLAKLQGTDAGKIQINKADGQRYVFIPPGEFTMGCSEGDRECDDDEKPPRKVQLTRGFWIGQTEVTQSAYKKVMKTNPSNFKGDDRPVEQVSWDEANAYCKAVDMRLPTEAEWEYAARAGSKGPRYGQIDLVAWYDGNSKNQTQPVAAKTPNEWGLYDMLGNVWEWVADWYDPKYYDKKVLNDPPGPASSPNGTRVVRGGSWYVLPRLVRVSGRLWGEPTLRYNLIGFRCGGELR